MAEERIQTYISLLRGINVSGQKIIRMEELRKMYEGLKLSNVRTYVQSGNVLFDCIQQDAGELTRQIETALESTLGSAVRVFIRDGNDLQRIIAGNPFLKMTDTNLSKLHVTFLYDTPPATALSSLNKAGDHADDLFISKNDIFLHCPDGYGRTKLSNAFFEKKLKVPATTRNWKTVHALFEMANGS
jgi:uncharacterized protein (DUF1697 family)